MAWWIGDDERPTLVDAVDRLDRLHTEGPSRTAFDFRHPFDAEGRPAARPTRRTSDFTRTA